MSAFKKYLLLREGNEYLEQPHIVNADPPMRIPHGIQRIADAFKNSKEVPIGKEVDSKAGGERNITLKSKKLFIAGDSVRDYLLGHTPTHFELVTDAHPEEVERIMQHAKPPIVIVRKDPKKGSVKVSVDGTTYTIETMKSKSLEFTIDPKEDAKRRDLTINALYYDVTGKKIIDYAGGLQDLKRGSVKFNGPAQEKLQDQNAKYRYAHMVNKVPNAQIDQEIKTNIEKHMKSGDDNSSPEQVRDHFWKGIEDLHVSPVKFIKTYDELGLLPTVFPGLDLNTHMPEIKMTKAKPIVLAWLLKNNRPQKLVGRLKELSYSDREIRDAVFLINLLILQEDYLPKYKQELLRTSLTKKQILDWAKLCNLDNRLIEKLVS